MPAWELANITARLLLPPGALLLLGLLGLALIRSRARLGMGLALFAFLSLYVLSTPLVARLLVQSLESPYTDPALGPSAESSLGRQRAGLLHQCRDRRGDGRRPRAFAATTNRRAGFVKPILKRAPPSGRFSADISPPMRWTIS